MINIKEMKQIRKIIIKEGSQSKLTPRVQKSKFVLMDRYNQAIPGIKVIQVFGPSIDSRKNKNYANDHTSDEPCNEDCNFLSHGNTPYVLVLMNVNEKQNDKGTKLLSFYILP